MEMGGNVIFIGVIDCKFSWKTIQRREFSGVVIANCSGIAEFAGLEFAGLENDGLEHDGLENDGVEQVANVHTAYDEVNAN